MGSLVLLGLMLSVHFSVSLLRVLVGNLGFFPCVGNDYGWFLLGFCGSRYQGGCCDFLFWGCFR